MNPNWKTALVNKGLNLLPPKNGQNPLQILIYHRVLDQPDPFRPWEVDRHQFKFHCEIFKKYYHVLELDDAIHRLNHHQLPKRALCITFDDGYYDNVKVALPLLKQYKFKASFFIATGYLDGKGMWNDAIIEWIKHTTHPVIDLSPWELGHYPLNSQTQKNKAIEAIIKKLKYRQGARRHSIVQDILKKVKHPWPDQLMMTPKDIVQLRKNGMTIGAHTVTHPILTRIDAQQAYREIAQSQKDLQRILKEPCQYFAYPNGQPRQDYASFHIQVLKELGFKGALSTWWGAATAQTDPFQLPRFTPWDQSESKFIFRMLQYQNKTKGRPIEMSDRHLV